MSNSDFLIRNTIRIECVTDKGISTGTGFFFEFDFNDGKKIPIIVTNKHVVREGKIGRLHFSIVNEKDEFIAGEKYTVNIMNFEQQWIMHPDDNVDLCIFPIASIIAEADKKHIRIAMALLTKNNIITAEQIKEISVIEDVTVVGYPDGIWDSYNNLPIVRKGITATPIIYDFEQKKEFLIDASIYGGSSGSPVFIFNQGSYNIGNSLVAGSRLLFVGIIYAVAQHTVTGELGFIDIPVSTKPVSVTQIPNNLGVVIKAQEMLVFEDKLKKIIKQGNA